MDIELISQRIRQSQGFEQNIGMEFISTPDPESCMARMHVDQRNRQPFGYLSGGAILALAETLAGVGSTALCPDCMCVGMNVNANHVHSAAEGETVTAVAYLVHRGGQTHVWRVEVCNEAQRLVSTVMVTNFIKPL